MLISRDRIVAALERREADRVPLFELTINPKVIEQISPGKSYYDFIEDMGYDAVGPNITWDAMGLERWLDRDKKIFLDRWGITRQYTAELIPVPLEGAIRSKKDLLNYTPPDPAEEPLLKLLPELLQRFQGEKATFILGRDAWTGSYMLRGMTNFLMDFATDPGMVTDIIRIQVEYYKEVHRLAIEQGIDIIALVDDYAYKSGPFVSPTQFKRFIYPAFCEIVEDIKSHGAYCTKHTDGNIWKIIDLLVDSGIDALGPLEPEAEMDLARVKAQYGDKIAVIGNVGCDLLGRGTPEDIRREVKKLLRSVSPGGGHILSSGNSIASSTQPENLLAMIQTCKEYGMYPISE